MSGMTVRGGGVAECGGVRWWVDGVMAGIEVVRGEEAEGGVVIADGIGNGTVWVLEVKSGSGVDVIGKSNKAE